MTDEYADVDATAQAELVRRGEVQPLELVGAAIARIERLNPLLDAVISRVSSVPNDARRANSVSLETNKGAC